MTHRIRSPWWPAAWLVVGSAAAAWWWASSDDAVLSAPIPPVASVPAAALGHAPTSATSSRSIAAAAQPVEPARAASTFKLVGTVKAANGADSFALVRRTADSQLVKLRAGDRIEGLTVSAIESDSVVLAGVGHSIVIEADRTAAAPALPAPSPIVGRPPVADVEPAWAGDPAPFGH